MDSWQLFSALDFLRLISLPLSSFGFSPTYPSSPHESWTGRSETGEALVQERPAKTQENHETWAAEPHHKMPESWLGLEFVVLPLQPGSA
jgi:hypothetical protein